MADDFINKDRFVFIDKSSIEVYDENLKEKRKVEIKNLSKELNHFNIKINDISKTSIDIQKRNLILNLALIVTLNKSLLKEFLKTKKLPLEKISALAYEPILNISPYEDYLKAYIILIKSDKYSSIVKHLNIFEKNIPGEKVKFENDIKTYMVSKRSYSDLKTKKVNKKSKGKEKAASNKGNNINNEASTNKSVYSGLILSKKSNGRIILTSSGEFKLVKKQKNHSNDLGEIIVSIEAKSFKNFKITLAIILALFIAVFLFLSSTQNKVSTTVLFKGNAEVKATFNKDNNLIHLYATNQNGNIILEDAEFEKKDLDYVLGEILEQSYIKKIVNERDTITVIISGAPPKEETLLNGRFNDRVVSYKIKCKINNDGTLIYLE